MADSRVSEIELAVQGDSNEPDAFFVTLGPFPSPEAAEKYRAALSVMLGQLGAIVEGGRSDE